MLRLIMQTKTRYKSKKKVIHEEDFQNDTSSGQFSGTGDERSTSDDGHDQDSSPSFGSASESPIAGATHAKKSKKRSGSSEEHHGNRRKHSDVQHGYLDRDTKKTEVETGHENCVTQEVLPNGTQECYFIESTKDDRQTSKAMVRRQQRIRKD